MVARVLHTPLDIYNAVTRNFPCATIHVTSISPVRVALTLSAELSVVGLNAAVDEQRFAEELLWLFQRNELAQVSKRVSGPKPLDVTRFSLAQPLSDWQKFRRVMYEKENRSCLNVIIAYLNQLDQTPPVELTDLGFAPAQILTPGIPICECDLAYFTQIMNRYPHLHASLDAKYPGLIQQACEWIAQRDLQVEASPDDVFYQEVLSDLQSRVLGQGYATETLVSSLLSQKNGSSKNGVFLFVGPTGTGKTELATAAGKWKKRMFVLPMNQYTSSYDVTRFFGSPTGLLGSDNPPDLARELDLCDPIKSISAEGKTTYIIKDVVILFDELEKAHSVIKQSFLNFFDSVSPTAGTVDISYTKRSNTHSVPDENVKIQYKLESCLLIGTSNLYQEEILGAFLAGETCKDIGEMFKTLNMAKPLAASYSPELLGRFTIMPFGPIPKGVVYQKLLESKMDSFVKKYVLEMGCREIVIDQQSKNLLYQSLENKLYGTGIGIRNVEAYFVALKKTVIKSRSTRNWGDIKNKKLTFYGDADGSWIKLSTYTCLRYTDTPLPRISIFDDNDLGIL